MAKINCSVSEEMHLVPLNPKDLMKIQQPYNYVEVVIDAEEQRSPVQLAKYWAELGELCNNMSEKSTALFLQNIIESISKQGRISARFIHESLKAIHGINSIALTVDNKEAREFFDFSFPMISRMKELFID